MDFNLEKSFLRLFTILIIITIISGCDIPKDPNKTYQNVLIHKQFRVGVIDNPPWIEFNNGNPTGIEAGILINFAKSLNVKIVWKKGNEHNLMQMLKENQIEIVAGGLDKKSPYAKEAGFTKTFFFANVYAGFPENFEIKNDLENLTVAAKQTGPAFFILQKEKAKVKKVNEFNEHNGIVAGYDWELIKAGYKLGNKKLATFQHVFAVPQGENKWLTEFENFLESKKDEIIEQIYNDKKN